MIIPQQTRDLCLADLADSLISVMIILLEESRIQCVYVSICAFACSSGPGLKVRDTHLNIPDTVRVLCFQFISLISQG